MPVAPKRDSAGPDLQALLDLDNARERFHEILKSTGRKHDGVSAPTNIFRDFQKPPAFVLFEIKEEDLPINLYLLGRERFIYLVWCVGINHSCRSCALPEYQSSSPGYR
jgi:hypothetical protein